MKRRISYTHKILIASGVNLDLLGRREPEIYGAETLADMERLLKDFLQEWKSKNQIDKLSLVFFQTNSEEKFLDEISKGYIGAVINAGAWTHTSLAIADRLRGVNLPFVEVHVSDVKKRERFRKNSFLKKSALVSISGHGIRGYKLGLDRLLKYLFL